jgi:Cdc6-like AAA superfamily ATPase
MTKDEMNLKIEQTKTKLLRMKSLLNATPFIRLELFNEVIDTANFVFDKIIEENKKINDLPDKRSEFIDFLNNLQENNIINAVDSESIVNFYLKNQ